MNFNITKTDDCFCIDGLGEWFQEQTRTIEWKSALIVFEKYKRSMNLEYDDLVQIRNHVSLFSKSRFNDHRKVNKDILTQEASQYVKREYSDSAENRNIKKLIAQSTEYLLQEFLH